MSTHSPLFRRIIRRLYRSHRHLHRLTNGPPALRTWSRLAAAAEPARARATTPSPSATADAKQTGTLAKKPSTKRQRLASGKRLGRKRLQLKRALEKEKRDMKGGDKAVFSMSQRTRLLGELGPVGELEEKAPVPAQRRITSPEEMRAAVESRRVGKSRLAETW